LNYWNGEFRDGYTNRGFLLGNTIGREGRSLQFWTTYTVSPLHTIHFSFKDSEVSGQFVPGGGRWHDYAVRHEIYLRSGVYVRSVLQLENIHRLPLLLTGSKRNVAASVELGFLPAR
jgi:hypothetical protein